MKNQVKILLFLFLFNCQVKDNIISSNKRNDYYYAFISQKDINVLKAKLDEINKNYSKELSQELYHYLFFAYLISSNEISPELIFSKNKLNSNYKFRYNGFDYDMKNCLNFSVKSAYEKRYFQLLKMGFVVNEHNFYDVEALFAALSLKRSNIASHIIKGAGNNICNEDTLKNYFGISLREFINDSEIDKGKFLNLYDSICNKKVAK